MRKLILSITTVGVLTSLFVSCSSEEVEGTDLGVENHDGHEHGPDGHHGPHDGKHKGEKPLPEQTKTLEEIGGFLIGDVATDFNLKNVDGEMVSLESYEDAKGYIVTFTCNECPFSVMYEDRLIELHNKYAAKGYPVVTINPNNPSNELEGYEAMQKRAEEKDFPFAYLFDAEQKVYAQYGAVRTPHVFLLDKDKVVQYIGTIDDNAKSAEDVKVKYVEDAINALENGEKPNPNFTKAIGCPVKS